MLVQTKVLQRRRRISENIKLLFEYRELLVTWTSREIRARYRQSILGFGWVLLQPLFQIVVLNVIFGGILRVPTQGIPYPVFAYVALLPWNLFAGSITASVPSVITHMELVTKIYFPREFLPLASILARLVDFAIASLIFFGLLVFYRVPIYPTIVFVPVLLVIQMILATGLGMLGAAVSVFVRDISFAIPLVMPIWMYACPVLYPLDMVPKQWLPLYLLNPMAGIIHSYRQVMLVGQPPNLFYLFTSAVISLLLFVIAYLFFKRVEMAMSDII